MRSLAASIFAVLALAAPAGAADKCSAPPGTAAMEQYCETIPSAGGNKTGTETGSGVSPSAGPSVSATTADRIADGIGDKATQVVTGVPRGQEAGRDGGKPARTKPSGTGADQAATGDEANPLSAVASAAGTGTEVGGPLVYTLLALTLLLVALAWARFRRSGN